MLAQLLASQWLGGQSLVGAPPALCWFCPALVVVEPDAAVRVQHGVEVMGARLARLLSPLKAQGGSLVGDPSRRRRASSTKVLVRQNRALAIYPVPGVQGGAWQ